MGSFKTKRFKQWCMEGAGNTGSRFKRIEYDYLVEGKTWTKDQILNDLSDGS